METSKNTPPKKAGPTKLPSKQIVFGNQGSSKGGGKSNKTNITSNKKGGVNLMRKLSGM